MAQRFDLKSMSLEGEPATIAEGAVPFSVSEEGTLVAPALRSSC